MGDLKQVIDAITAMDQRLTASINEVKQQNNTIINEFNIIKTEFKGMIHTQLQIKEDLTAVNVQVEILKQKSLSSEIVINGIPDKLLGKEILLQTINKIFNILDCKEVRPWDYRSIFLMKKKSNSSGFTPVCLQLCSSAHKNMLIYHQKQKGTVLLQQLDTDLPSSDFRKIVIKDRMTPYYSDLMKKAFLFKNKFDYKYVWFKETVLIKKTDTSQIIRVFSKEDLLIIEGKHSDVTEIDNNNEHYTKQK